MDLGEGVSGNTKRTGMSVRILERCKGHTHKGHREKILNVTLISGFFRVFSGYFQGVFREFQGISGNFQGVFRVFFPMPFPGLPFGPFQASELRRLGLC